MCDKCYKMLLFLSKDYSEIPPVSKGKRDHKCVVSGCTGYLRSPVKIVGKMTRSSKAGIHCKLTLFSPISDPPSCEILSDSSAIVIPFIN
jgi:hypothetical protein